MTKVKINGNEYIANINGTLRDPSWDDRESKTIEFYEILSASEVAEMFCEGCSWSIIYEYDVEEPILNNNGEPTTTLVDGVNPTILTHTVTKREEYDNSDFSMAGPVTDYRNGIVSVKMAKLTELEAFIEDLYGGEE